MAGEESYYVYDDPVILFNEVDITGWVESAGISQNRQSTVINTMGSPGPCKVFSTRSGGDSLSLTFVQDFTASAVEATIGAAIGTAVTVTIQPTGAAVSATNPQWTAEVEVEDYMPLDGEVGTPVQQTQTWTVNGKWEKAVE